MVRLTTRDRWPASGTWRPARRLRHSGKGRQIASMAALALLFAGGACQSSGVGSVSTSSSTSTSTSMPRPLGCDASGMCVVEGRPLRRRRGLGLLLPARDPEAGPGDDEARSEYASVASFGELALRLIAVGAPSDLVAACHRAALDEIRHASVVDRLAGRERARFGAIPELLGRRVGGRHRTRRGQLQVIAVESYLDGWVNEGAAAARLRLRAEQAKSHEISLQLGAMADDEQRHADLGRAIVTWCFQEDPRRVGRALAAVVRAAA